MAARDLLATLTRVTERLRTIAENVQFAHEEFLTISAAVEQMPHSRTRGHLGIAVIGGRNAINRASAYMDSATIDCRRAMKMVESADLERTLIVAFTAEDWTALQKALITAKQRGTISGSDLAQDLAKICRVYTHDRQEGSAAETAEVHQPGS
jgi:hypothetical protein